MVFNATFNNISDISWRSVLLRVIIEDTMPSVVVVGAIKIIWTYTQYEVVVLILNLLCYG